MIEKRLFQISKIILIIFFLNLFAWSVYYVHSGGKKIGALTDLIKGFSSFPNLIIDVFKEVNHPSRLLTVESDLDFELINSLKYDLFAVNGAYSDDKWVLKLINLRNDSTIFDWFLDNKDFVQGHTIFSHAPPQLPLILKDTSIVFFNTDSHNLYRINSKSEIMWKLQDPQYFFHHSLNPGHSEDIWVCTRDFIQVEQEDIQYWDDNLTQIDLKDGKVLFHKSLSEILIENHLNNLIFGAAFGHDDPLHLNDIQPVLLDGTFWKKGDLFLSLRNTSTILLYRPSSNKIIKVIQGPFYFQHDVDVVTDSTISIFNNNVSAFSSIEDSDENPVLHKQRLDRRGLAFNRFSQVMLYNFIDSSFSLLHPDQFEKHQVFTKNEGLQQILSNGDLFVESSDQGKIFIFADNKVVLKKYVNTSINGFVEYPHWIRLYENLDFLK